ncbi:uncharacterized protein LOC135809568 isoform X1 [Sycon ciliatum]|uniref:uncharacterized protein LOC135809568 isoform X1 n=1 Tax=Sycon ciliatum TaxID=27933 RepID=UPI0031F68BB5
MDKQTLRVPLSLITNCNVSCPDPANIFLTILAKLRWGPAFGSSSSASPSSESTAGGVLSPILKSSISGSYEVSPTSNYQDLSSRSPQDNAASTVHMLTNHRDLKPLLKRTAGNHGHCPKTNFRILRECFGEATVFLVDTSPNVTDAFLVAAGNVMMEFVTTASRTTAGSIAVMAYGAARSYSGQAQMIFNNEPKTSKGKRLLRKRIKSIARRPSISDAPDSSSAIRLTDQLQSKSQIWQDIIVMNPNGIRYITPSGHTYQNLEMPFPSSSQTSPCSIESTTKSSRDCLAYLRDSLFTHYLWKPRSIFEDNVMLSTQDLPYMMLPAQWPRQSQTCAGSLSNSTSASSTSWCLNVKIHKLHARRLRRFQSNGQNFTLTLYIRSSSVQQTVNFEQHSNRLLAAVVTVPITPGIQLAEHGVVYFSISTTLPDNSAEQSLAVTATARLVCGHTPCTA